MLVIMVRDKHIDAKVRYTKENLNASTQTFDRLEDVAMALLDRS